MKNIRRHGANVRPTTAIRVDKEVRDTILARMDPLNDTYNTYIRRILGLRGGQKHGVE